MRRFLTGTGEERVHADGFFLACSITSFVEPVSGALNAELARSLDSLGSTL
jgi:hypothetical protein